ncbi:MAG: hypothetical protein ACJAQ6_001090 [Arenicella sp.]|jgi:hypothetical protein
MISGFARGINPNFSKMEKHFADYYEGDQQASLVSFLGNFNASDKARASKRFKLTDDQQYQQKRLEFGEFIRRSYKDSEHGIAVLLDMGRMLRGKPDMQWHAPTPFGAPRLNQLWNRFNVEVSISENCKSISIILWQRGVSITEFDHLAVSEQGDAVDGSRANFNLDAQTLMQEIAVNDVVATRFLNLSFE